MGLSSFDFVDRVLGGDEKSYKSVAVIYYRQLNFRVIEGFSNTQNLTKNISKVEVLEIH